MEATALSVGKSVLDGALGYAKSAVAEEVALQLGVQRDHAFIRDELEMMQSFLMAAHEDGDEHKANVFMTWVKQVRDVAYDAEDCLHNFSVHLHKPSWWRLPSTLRERRRVAKQMKELRARVEDVSQRNLRYQLVRSAGSKSGTGAEHSSITAAAIFGIDDARRAARHDKPKEDLVDLINQEGEDLRVIALWGTSGDLGLTSIINMAYENPDIRKKFICRAWVRISHPFNANDFIQSIVKQFRSAVGIDILLLESEKTGKELAQEFTGYINDNSYLVVLNDLTTFEDWKGIKAYLPNHKKGSRIIVSSPQVKVASLCAGQESHALELKQLSADQTIYAFYEKVFKEAKDLDKHPELMEEARKILNKCNGLPLAIVTIGGFLANQPKVAVVWRKLNEHISAELEMNPELEAIKTMLVHMPRGIGKLKALHTLGLVNLAWDKAILQDIKRLTQLRKLAVTGINKKNGQEFCSVVANLNCLESLLVQSRGYPGICDCLDGISSPPKNLQSLKLYGDLAKLPRWIEGLHTLVKLTLRSSRILEYDEAMQVLGKLQNLASLRLWAKALQGEDFCLTFHPEAFPSLTVLGLNDIDGLRSVEFEEGAMLQLERVDFSGRHGQVNAGMFSGLAALPSLREFMLDSDKYKEDFVKDVQAQLAQNPNAPVLKR
nr:unnamed protein product [Digitaria exilis]